MSSLAQLWPLFDLRIETPRLTLRYPSDADLEVLANLAEAGIHEPDYMPFVIPWTDAPAHLLGRNALQFWWGLRASWKEEAWTMFFVVRESDTIVGIQQMMASQFKLRREFLTGSWLGKTFQRRGIGKEMRAAVLHLAFEGLGAIRANSGAWHDNRASIAVSRSLGYVDNGDEVLVRRGEPVRHLRFVLDRETWLKHRRSDIRIVHLGRCLPMFGLDTTPSRNGAAMDQGT